MRHLAQARNPYSLQGLWIPGSLASLTPRNDEEDGVTQKRPSQTLILPGEQISESHVESPLQKYFCFRVTQITSPSPAIPAHTKGRFAIVTDVGFGMRWTRHVKRRMTLRADGEVVWS